MSWMGGWFDPELEDLFHDDPELLETARQVRAARPRSEPDPRFQNRLRAQLVAEASRGFSARGVRRWWRLGPTHFAWGGAVVGAALITATVFTFVSNHAPDQTVTAFSQLTAQHSVSPNQVITVAFNQPMDEHAVEAGVQIQPAIKVTYSWKDNNLVISPAYHLSANTPYTVTIAQTAIRASSGALAVAPINITFGTAPTPTPGPVVPPSLSPAVVGSNGTGGSLLYAPDGSLVSTVGLLPASATTSQSPTVTAAGATPTASPTPTPEGAITQTPEVPGSLVEFPRSGAPTQLGPLPPSAAAFSPNGGRYLASAVDNGNGGSTIVVTRSDGTQTERLVDSTTPVTALTWATNDRIIYTDGTAIWSVDVSKAKAQLYSHTGSGTITALALGGGYAYVSPAAGTGGALLNINTDTAQVLTGAVSDVAFSGDGTIVAWVDESAHPARILTESIARGASTQAAPTVLSTPDATASPSDVALDLTGDEIAYLSTDSAGVAELVVAQLASGTPLAVESPSNATQITLSPPGDQVAFVSNTAGGASIEQATVPGATTKPHGPQIPAGANRTLQQFVQAQVGQDGQPDFATLGELSAPGKDFSSSTPQDLSRAYVISTYLDQGVVGASIELIVDPSSGHTTTRFASETLLIAQGPSGGYVVTSAHTSQLRDQSAGPHVVQVSSNTANGVTTLQVSFDSDLNPGSVASAISVLSASGTTLPSTAVYNPDTRIATVTIDNAPAGTLTLDIATTLADFKGQTLVQGFTTNVEANS
jgi:Bacterial Ig-like domain